MESVGNTKLVSTARRKAMGSHQSTRMNSDRWLTPKWIVDALGSFDLDPCGAPGHLLASEMYLLEDEQDGMSLPWSGRIWLNPPYGREAAQWMQRLAEHGVGTALIFARTETQMIFNTVWSRASAVLFLKGRLFFLRPDGVAAKFNAGAPSILVAYGDRDADLLEVSGIEGHFVRLASQTVKS